MEYAEPNYKISITGTDYDFNDEHVSHTYYMNDNSSTNTTSADIVKEVNMHGSSEKSSSMNLSYGWKAFDNAEPSVKNPEKPVVAAVIDSGVNYNHEDLRNRMWTNPGNIGISGEHGYDFINNDADPMDDSDHGTWCAGCIAAEAGNGVGIPGCAGKADVKIMALKVLDANGAGSTSFAIMEAFNYVERAVDNGVNVKLTSNSYGGSHYSSRGFDKVINTLGQKGVLHFAASGNDAINIDHTPFSPAWANSDYTVVVNALKEDNEPASFSNYGVTQTDLYAPGNNTLSTIAHNCYYPCIYSPKKLEETTSYYGEFSKDTAVDGSSVVPEVGNDGAGRNYKANSFGASKMILPENNDEARAELSIDDTWYFNNSEKPACLKWELKNVKQGDKYYLYFPYEKDELSNGSNTYSSVQVNYLKNNDYAKGKIQAGDCIVTNSGGIDFKSKGGAIVEADVHYLSCHLNNNGSLFSYDEVNSKRVSDYGLALCYTAEKDGDVSFLIDSLAISKAGANADTFGKYDTFSGTSMATPAAAGAAALLCALHPDDDALSLKNRLYSILTKEDDLKDLCSTGGRIDFNNLPNADELPSVINAHVDKVKGIVTLSGSNLGSVAGSIKYKNLYKDGSSFVTVPASSITWSNDEIRIENAKELVGKYVSLEVTAANGKDAKASFYLNNLSEEAEGGFRHLLYESPNMSEAFSDGENFYYSDAAGDLYLLNNDGAPSRMTEEMLSEKLLDTIIANLRIEDTYKIEEEEKAQFDILVPTMLIGRTVYEWVRFNLSGTEYNYLSTLDLNESAKNRKWKFTEITSENREKLLPDVLSSDGVSFATYNDRIYCMGTDENDGISKNVYVFDPSKMAWEKLLFDNDPFAPAVFCMSMTEFKGCLYGMYGFKTDGDGIEVNRDLYCFDGKSFKKYVNVLPELINPNMNKMLMKLALGTTKEGIIVSGLSTDGYGDTFLLKMKDHSIEPLNASLYPGINDKAFSRGASTRDKFYVVNESALEYAKAYDVYVMDIDSSGYEAVKTEASGKGSGTISGAGTYLNGRTISVKAVPGKNSYIDSAKDGKTNITSVLKKGAYKFTADGGSRTIKVSFGKYVEKVRFTKKISSLKVGKTGQVKAIADGTITGVTYKSSNTKYATVNSKGVVKALKAGKGKKVKITAVSKGKNSKGKNVKSTITIKVLAK